MFILHSQNFDPQKKSALVISTINQTAASYLLGIVAAEYILNWVPPGTHSHSKFVTPSQLTRELHSVCAHSELSMPTALPVRGITLSPLTQQWSLSDCDAVNYILAFSLDGSPSKVNDSL